MPTWRIRRRGRLSVGPVPADYYRRTIADLLAGEYYGTVATEAHARGLTYYTEALEDHRPQLGDDLTMRSSADVPMGAMAVRPRYRKPGAHIRSRSQGRVVAVAACTASRSPGPSR